MGTIIKDGVQYSGFGGQGAVIDDTVERVDTTWSSRKIAEEVGACAKATTVYTKSQTYTKAEVDDLLANIPSPDLSNYYTKSQTYTKSEVDDLLDGKADAANAMRYDSINSKVEYNNNGVWTEVPSSGGGAEIDDTTVAADKVWSSNKTRAELLKASGLQYTSYIGTKMSLIRAKIIGSDTATRNAMQEQFSADYQYSLVGRTLSVTIMYADGSAGQTATISLTDIPWNDLANAEYDSNYPDDNARWKRIVASEDIFEVCIAGNVSTSSGYYYPYIFVRVPKGTYTASISLSTSLGTVKWTKAGKVGVINGYATDPTSPIHTYDITSLVSSSTPVDDILQSALTNLVSTFKRDVDSVQNINKFVIEARQTDFNGNTIIHRAIWNIVSMRTVLPYSTSTNMTLRNFNAQYDKGNGTKWIYDNPFGSLGTLFKETLSIPTSTGSVTGSRPSDSTSTIDTVVFGNTDTSWTSWNIKFYV